MIFKLYDTFGFPVDIVRDVVRDQGMTLDMEAFEREMAKQREKSRSVTAFTKISAAYRGLSAQGVAPRFVGYDRLSCDARVLLIVRDGEEVQSARTGETVEVVASETPFYGESGGQVGDQGKITAPQLEMVVNATAKDPTGVIIHKGQITSGTLAKGAAVTLTVDGESRRATARNHTATHILHAILRQVLGDHVRQAGSLVAADRLRFDFTHFSQVDPAALDRIETLVNDQIRENLAAQTVEMAAEEALKSGAMALFEEKYGDRVRVVSLADFSQELCGGTHTERTGDIGVFKIVMETSVAAGVRRIEAMTGAAALAHLQQQVHIVQNAARLLKDKPEGLVQRIEGLLHGQKALEKEVERLERPAGQRLGRGRRKSGPHHQRRQGPGQPRKRRQPRGAARAGRPLQGKAAVRRGGAGRRQRPQGALDRGRHQGPDRTLSRRQYRQGRGRVGRRQRRRSARHGPGRRHPAGKPGCGPGEGLRAGAGLSGAGVASLGPQRRLE